MLRNWKRFEKIVIYPLQMVIWQYCGSRLKESRLSNAASEVSQNPDLLEKKILQHSADFHIKKKNGRARAS